MIEVVSMKRWDDVRGQPVVNRREVLSTPPPPGVAVQVLGVAPGTSGRQALAWAAELLKPAAVDELRAILDADDAS